ncbi:MAG: phosphodiesterase [Clostridia bacterium]|nr:phosphodiesterase [Clostridia bacterium]
MKLLICSDIHGDLDSAKAVIDAYHKLSADKILCLGDILYHGPRNDLPPTYAPKEVITLLNSYKNVILSVRGNCDTEVDQMVLEFPILADYAILSLDGKTVYATHGHKFNLDTLPPLQKGDILLHGHTHLLTCEKFGEDNVCLNPGSVALPKGGNPRSYMIYEDGVFTCVDLVGNTIFKYK